MYVKKIIIVKSYVYTAIREQMLMVEAVSLPLPQPSFLRHSLQSWLIPLTQYPQCAVVIINHDNQSLIFGRYVGIKHTK